MKRTCWVWETFVLYGLTGCDASYLHLAMRNGLALATLDEKLRAAAKMARIALWELKRLRSTKNPS